MRLTFTFFNQDCGGIRLRQTPKARLRPPLTITPRRSWPWHQPPDARWFQYQQSKYVNPSDPTFNRIRGPRFWEHLEMRVPLPMQCHRGKMETACCLSCGVDVLQLLWDFNQMLRKHDSTVCVNDAFGFWMLLISWVWSQTWQKLLHQVARDRFSTEAGYMTRGNPICQPSNLSKKTVRPTGLRHTPVVGKLRNVQNVTQQCCTVTPCNILH